MNTPFRTTRRVEFCETDAAGIAHFSAFFQYMEQAEHALLRHCGLSVVLEDDEGLVVSWPRVSASCEYEGAVKFEDELDIEVMIEQLGERSVTYAFLFRLDGGEIAKGRLTAVCCHIEHDQPPRSIEIPGWISERLQLFVVQPGYEG